MNILWWIVIECDSFRLPWALCLTAYPSMLNSTVFSSGHIHFSVRQIISLTESTGSLLIGSIFGQSDLQFLCSRSSCSILWTSDLLLLSKPKNPNLTSTQGWVWQHNDCANHTAPHPTTQTQHQLYLSCYWPDFDETLKVGSCEHLEQIPSVMVTFVTATFVLATFVHIRNISVLTVPILMKL